MEIGKRPTILLGQQAVTLEDAAARLQEIFGNDREFRRKWSHLSYIRDPLEKLEAQISLLSAYGARAYASSTRHRAAPSSIFEEMVDTDEFTRRHLSQYFGRYLPTAARRLRGERPPSRETLGQHLRLFQKDYNRRFAGALEVNGILTPETRTALFNATDGLSLAANRPRGPHRDRA